ncbi:iron-sulfur cluster assembly scaffold protein [bacterium]|nr:iron-sulfur cluster assembly scaffold protein [bacterium]
MKYSAIVLDHVKNPRNVGELEDANARARVRSSADGDLLQLHMRIEGGVVAEARFKVYGCGAAIATGSMLTELVLGKTVEELRKISNEQMSELMGELPPEKIHCSVLAEQAVVAALEDWRKIS